MAGKASKPTFFWQGVLILLPVAVLAVVSLISLHRDEQAAENDARRRAAESAQSLARAMRATVDEELHRFLTLQNDWMSGLHSASQASVNGIFPDAKLQADIEKWVRDYPGLEFSELALSQGTILADGRQIEPPDSSVAPQPPKWFRELSAEQRNLWGTLRAAGGSKEINARWQDFRDAHPSAEAEQAAMLLTRPPEQIIHRTVVSPSESGISFEEIATYKLLTATNAQLTDSLLQSIWWRVINAPSVVSPKLLDLAGGLTNRANPAHQQKFFWISELFNDQSRADEYLASLRSLPDLKPWKKLWWSHWSSDGSVLAVFQPKTFVTPENDSDGNSLSGQGYQVWLAPRVVVQAIFNRALTENQFLVPPYAATQIAIEGVLVPQRGQVPAALETSLLGEADQKAGNYFAQDAIPFSVKFFLSSREQMLSTERQRARLFGALIFCAALTAFAGLLAARRAFRTQLRLSEAKSNFVSSVSHELRAPIASVRLMAESLERGKVNEVPKQNEYFRFIVQECRRLTSLIENVLDFSRIEQGRKQYEFEPTDLAALTRETVKLMEPYASEKGVILETSSIEPAAPEANRTSNVELEVDGRAMQQALVNLMDNAIKHSPKGAAVKIGFECDGHFARLWVEDHGPGIPPEEHERIFERFYRLGSELRRETQGVGIGLSIVRHIVDAHGGNVTVRSSVGHGSRFTIELPATSKRPANEHL